MRSSNVDNLMTIVQKQNEIEADINVLKESHEGFNKKMSFNNRTIEQLESDIVKL